MNIYDLILISTTVTEKGILTDMIQKAIVILSAFGGILAIFGGITYLFQKETDESVLQIDEFQHQNFKRVVDTQDLTEDVLKEFFTISTDTQRHILSRIIKLEATVEEIKGIIEKSE